MAATDAHACERPDDARKRQLKLERLARRSGAGVTSARASDVPQAAVGRLGVMSQQNKTAPHASQPYPQGLVQLVGHRQPDVRSILRINAHAAPISTPTDLDAPIG